MVIKIFCIIQLCLCYQIKIRNRKGYHIMLQKPVYSTKLINQHVKGKYSRSQCIIVSIFKHSSS